MAAGTRHPPGRQKILADGVKRGDDALHRAIFAMNSGRPVEAQQLAEEILKRDSRHARASHILGCALLVQNRPQDAIAPLEAAARGRNDPELDIYLATALRQTGRHEEAVSRLKRTTKRWPTNAPAIHELGYALASLGRYDEAIETFRRGLEVAPMMPLLSIHLGEALLERRKYAEARSAFANALGIVPGSSEALLGKGKADQELGNFREAAESFRRYLASSPDDAVVWGRFGQCLLELGQLETGYDCFRQAARTHYEIALGSLVRARRGRFWLKPSEALRFLNAKKK
ncbi:MAG: tetratricopeptide repeat protein [Xanthobacteraceae bacterium]